MSGEDKSWVEYHLSVGNHPNHLVMGVLNGYEIGRSACLDLGAGNLRDSKALLKQGFKRVVAVDHSNDSLPYVTEGIELIIMPLESFVIDTDTFDFIFSCNTFFYLPYDHIKDLVQRVHKGLKSGGIFACNVLGEYDRYIKTKSDTSRFTEENLERLFESFEVLGQGEAIDPTGEEVFHQRSMAVRKL